MALDITTFTNADAGAWRPGNNAGGSSLFKALGHPLIAEPAAGLARRLGEAGPVAVYDPLGQFAAFAALYDISGWDLAGVFVQRLEEVGTTFAGHAARPVTELAETDGRTLFVAAFDSARLRAQIAHLLPDGVAVTGFDDLRLPDGMLSDPTTYLAPLNFATNFAFLRDSADQRTRIVTANYWAAYGAADPALWLCLFDADGSVLAQWEEPLPAANASVVLDSRELRARFGLGDFAGSLFIHAVRIAGHDVVKYALDTVDGAGGVVSCTHDANAWPADLYAGMPAPEDGESLVLWIQNSHPTPIAAGAIGVNLVGSQDIARLDAPIPPFGTHALDIASLLPDARWPAQIEVQAGRYFVRPRYEVFRDGGPRRIAHANVERTDLRPDPAIPALARTMGKGYILPLPVLPLAEFETEILPTPMATCQDELPVALALYDADGAEIDRRFLGRLARRDSRPVDIGAWLAETGGTLPTGYGHVELVYDFRDGGAADGWLHGLARFRQRASGHRAETIFGAHIYNTPLTYRDEPQSYAGPPPGLSTRLFLRLGPAPADTLCHLIYPASQPWHARSATDLILHDGGGREVTRTRIEIPCGGARHWRYTEMFDADARAAAGENAYAIVRDPTCRLFGFHGLVEDGRAFSLDHMFGF